MKNVKLGKKLIGGFVAVAILCAIVGYIGMSKMLEIRNYGDETATVRVPSLIGLDMMNEGQTGVQRAERTAILAALTDQKAEAQGQAKRYADKWAQIDKGWKIYEPLPQTEEEARVWKELVPVWGKWRRDTEQVMSVLAGGDVERAQALSFGDARNSFNEAEKLLGRIIEIQGEAASVNDAHSDAAYAGAVVTLWTIIIVAVVAAILMGVFLSRSITTPMGEAVDMMQEMEKGHLNKRLKLDRGDEIGVMAGAMDRFAEDLQNNVVAGLKKVAAGDMSTDVTPKDSRDEIGPALKATIEALRGLVTEVGMLAKAGQEGQLSVRGNADQFQGSYREIVSGVNATLDAVVTPINEAASVLEQVAAKDLTVRVKGDYRGDFAKIKDSINTAVQNLDEGMGQVGVSSEQVSSAAGQISSGSQSLAEGASEQASSLEEISSSLEEMSSMTKQNADNANQAKTLSQGARTSADKGTTAMGKMTGAIDKIKTSSDETAKIVKTIDEIAFQTNLLALNAAVEAARAGEAGKGFAVVAEEVRNLAQRSAEAAKTTANMIEGSVKNAEEGVRVTEEVASILGEITEGSRKVNDLVAEIAAASGEQSQGIEQVNTAVTQLDKVTQQNAANAEESASAAEELNGQSEELRALLGTFVVSNTDGHRSSRGPALHRTAVPEGLKAPAPRAKNGAARREIAKAPVASGKRHSGNGTHSAKADQVFPLDEQEDEELKSF